KSAKAKDVINLQGKDNKTPLHVAIDAAKDPNNPNPAAALAVVKALAADKNIDFKKADKNGNSPIHAAVASGNPGILKIILDPSNQNLTKVPNSLVGRPYAYLPINQPGKDNKTPLHLAIDEAAKAAVEVAKAHENDPDRDEKKQKATAALEVVEALAADPNIDFKKADVHGNNIIQAAVASGNPDILKTILNPDNRNLTKPPNSFGGRPYAYLPINQKNSAGKTPLHVAIDAAKDPNNPNPAAALEVVKALAADKNIDFKKEDGNGNNIIQAAVASGNPEIIKTLLENTAKAMDVINLQDTNNDNKTPLHVAIENAAKAAKDAKDSPASIEKEQTAKNMLKMVEILANDKNIDFNREEIDPNKKGKGLETNHNIIFAAVKAGNPDILKKILHSDNPNLKKPSNSYIKRPYLPINQQSATGNTPLHRAIDAAKAANAAKDAKDAPTIAKAAAALEVVKALAADPNIDFTIKNNSGNSPIQRAIASNNIDIVKIIADKLTTDTDKYKSNFYKPINQQDETKNTMLHVAINAAKDPNNPKAAEALAVVKALAADPNIDFKKEDGNGNNIIQAAIASNNIGIVKIIADKLTTDTDKYKSNFYNPINQQDETKNTMLHVAINAAKDPNNPKAAEALEVVKALAADPNIDFKKVDKHGNNIIKAAVASGNPDILKIILNPNNRNLTKPPNSLRGRTYNYLPINQKNNDNETALHVAINVDNHGMIKTLLDADANPNIKFAQKGIQNTDNHKNDRPLHVLIRKLRSNQLADPVNTTAKDALEATFFNIANRKNTGLDKTNSDGLTPINLAADIVNNQRVWKGPTPQINDPDQLKELKNDAQKKANELFDTIIGKLKGLDVNKKDNKGEGPLHKIFHKEGINSLIALGADVDLKNKENKTPLDKAVDEKYLEGSITLINNGASISTAAKEYLADISYDDRKSIGYDSYLRAAAKSTGIYLDAKAPITHAQRHEITEKLDAEINENPEGPYTVGEGLLKKYEPSEQIKEHTSYKTSSTGFISIEQHINEAKLERIIKPDFKLINSASQEITYIARMIKTGMAEVDPAEHRGKLYEQRKDSGDGKAFYSDTAKPDVHSRYLELSDFIRDKKITTEDVADAAAKFKSDGKDDSYEFAATNLYLLEIIKGYENNANDPNTKNKMLDHLKTLAEIDGRDNILKLVKGVESRFSSTTFASLKEALGKESGENIEKAITELNDGIDTEVVREITYVIDSMPKTGISQYKGTPKKPSEKLQGITNTHDKTPENLGKLIKATKHFEGLVDKHGLSAKDLITAGYKDKDGKGDVTAHEQLKNFTTLDDDGFTNIKDAFTGEAISLSLKEGNIDKAIRVVGTSEAYADTKTTLDTIKTLQDTFPDACNGAIGKLKEDPLDSKKEVKAALTGALRQDLDNKLLVIATTHETLTDKASAAVDAGFEEFESFNKVLGVIDKFDGTQADALLGNFNATLKESLVVDSKEIPAKFNQARNQYIKSQLAEYVKAPSDPNHLGKAIAAAEVSDNSLGIEALPNLAAALTKLGVNIEVVAIHKNDPTYNSSDLSFTGSANFISTALNGDDLSAQQIAQAEAHIDHHAFNIRLAPQQQQNEELKQKMEVGLNQSNKKIDDLSHKFVRATEELASNTTKISDLTTAQGAMATIIIDLKGALEKNTKEFTELKTQQSQLELLATTTQTGLTTLKQEVHQITTKLKEHVETQIKNIENQIKKESKSAKQSTKALISNSEKELKLAMTSSKEEILQQYQGLNNKIVTLETASKSQNTNQEKLQKQITALTTNIDSCMTVITAANQGIETKVDQISERITKLEKSVADANSSIDEQKRNITAALRGIDGNTEAINNLAERINGINLSVAQEGVIIQALGAEIGKLDATLAATSVAQNDVITRLTGQVAELETKLDAMASKQDATPDAIEALKTEVLAKLGELKTEIDKIKTEQQQEQPQQHVAAPPPINPDTDATQNDVENDQEENNESGVIAQALAILDAVTSNLTETALDLVGKASNVIDVVVTGFVGMVSEETRPNDTKDTKQPAPTSEALTLITGGLEPKNNNGLVMLSADHEALQRYASSAAAAGSKEAATFNKLLSSIVPFAKETKTDPNYLLPYFNAALKASLDPNSENIANTFNSDRQAYMKHLINAYIKSPSEEIFKAIEIAANIRNYDLGIKRLVIQENFKQGLDGRALTGGILKDPVVKTIENGQPPNAQADQ
ncbi:MAG: hypothetical protein HON78_02410, partial [Legionellales bacterium]|nr:hypothetical protein [Legionellales bacterium]